MAIVTISVRSMLGKVIDELETLGNVAKNAPETIKRVPREAADAIQKVSRKTYDMLSMLGSFSGRVARGMIENFKALASAVGISQGLKFGNIMATNIAQTFKLSDEIRRLASVFGIAKSQFVSFQTALTKGLGDVGLGADEAVNALKGLSETQVRGQKNLVEYSKTAGMLAQTTGQKGQEGTIAKGIANVITEAGGNPNDLRKLNEVADGLRRVFNATGKAPAEILGAMEEIVSKMPQDLRKSISIKGITNLATAAATGGKSSTEFLKQYLTMGPTQRQVFDVRGFKDIFTDKGLDTKKFKKGAENVFSQYGKDPRLMAQTLGLSEEAAEGFVRLYESIDRVSDAQDRMQKDNKSLEQQFFQSAGAMESFLMNLNKFKAGLAEPIAWVTTKLTDVLQTAFKTSFDDIARMLPDSFKPYLDKLGEFLPKPLKENLGSTAVVAGGVGLAATLFGGGLKGIKGLLGFGQSKATGIAERTAYEQITGAKIQDVYVVNASEIGQASKGIGGGLADAAGGLGIVGKTLAVGGALAGGYAVGEYAQRTDTGLDKATRGAVDSLFGEGATEKFNQTVENGVNKLVSMLAELAAPAPTARNNNGTMRVIVEPRTKDLKTSVTPSRGAAITPGQ